MLRWFLIVTIYINAPGDGVQVIGEQKVSIAMPSREVCRTIKDLQIDNDAKCWALDDDGAPEVRE